MVRRLFKTAVAIVVTIIILILMIGFASVVNTLSEKKAALQYNTCIRGGQDDYCRF